MAKCLACDGRGWYKPWGYLVDCTTCNGRGKVMDFAFPALLRWDGHITYRATEVGGGPYRFTLPGAREYAAGLREMSTSHKPNSIVRVYLK